MGLRKDGVSADILTLVAKNKKVMKREVIEYLEQNFYKAVRKFSFKYGTHYYDLLLGDALFVPAKMLELLFQTEFHANHKLYKVTCCYRTKRYAIATIFPNKKEGYLDEPNQKERKLNNHTNS